VAPHRFASQQSLDLGTVLRATQAISRETHVEGVLERVMSSAIDNAGAQRGGVLLPREGTLTLEFERGLLSAGPKLGHAPLDQCEERLPVSVVNYVVRTLETVVLGDASGVGLFTHDPYVRRTRAKSVLCAPILNQSKLAGVFYLENALVPDAFSEERLEILRMLSAQAAISMENARLYDELRQARLELERRVTERTTELREANGRLRLEVDERRRAQLELEAVQTELVTTARRAGMAEVATGVLHNVGNVLNSVNVATTVLADRIGNSRIPGVGRAVSLLVAHEDDLARFLTEDRRGPRARTSGACSGSPWR
jgi:GAF domain-containing protein